MSDKIISLAPARTCLFGDHQDYLELPIIACAINRYIKLVATKNHSNVFQISKPDINEETTISIDAGTGEIELGDHFLSALKVVQKYGCIPTEGYDITISGNIAINAGTSSSSAVIIAWIKFLLEAYGCNQKVTPLLISDIAYQAEVVEQKASGGKMDQYSIALGNIIYLETDEKSYYETINKPIEGLIVGESGIPKETLSLLKELKEKTWLSVFKIKEKVKNFTLKDAKIEDLNIYLNYLPTDLQPYLYAAISNYDVTKRALNEFRKPSLNLPKIGALINEHHTILRDSLQITVPRIDDMIDAANKAGAYGSKIVGSGKGGSIVVLSPKEKEQQVVNAIIEAGGVNSYPVSVDSGARIIDKSMEKTIQF
ncbi:mevalonate kinase [Tenacibaculum sp. UWU-22]|uniref:mevalonate kinase family protein n=1 Tax=Tenacibaculum sp. UWU-22 TaxID=3234187 RepID=UPI0034DAE17C